ncbi:MULTISPECIES: hypothetical protein [unclassified Granulicatella]|uniref:hypothetical protein n=1 Tax=unclassified Granulicatella TaxID=2630493 RepID=UPI001072F467|nr:MULTISPECIES: hypothetical protein [unclassified Granulicatella]MBF0779791.1 hypothetical protein [Granulicatella sp. 19428wC4_WM01]TFU96193.1 hypothetical protein E4T68_01665 [Granulicatella sp. WM01]
MDKEELQAVRNLCCAVVEQAIIDYKQALKFLLLEQAVDSHFQLKDTEKEQGNEHWRMKQTCEYFFRHNELCRLVVRYNPQKVIHHIRKQVLELCEM